MREVSADEQAHALVEVFLILAEAYQKEMAKEAAAVAGQPVTHPAVPAPPPPVTYTRLKWNGKVAPQTWAGFYQKVLARFASGGGLKLTVRVEIAPEGGLSEKAVEETRLALRELGLSDKAKVE